MTTDNTLSTTRNDQFVLPPSARAFIESGKLAHLVTVNANGSPQVSMVWTGIEGDELFMFHLGGYSYQKLKNIDRDPRVSVSMQGEGFDENGATPHLVVHGVARYEEGDIGPLMARLAQTYLGERADDIQHLASGPGFITRITPKRIGGYGPWIQGE